MVIRRKEQLILLSFGISNASDEELFRDIFPEDANLRVEI